MGSQKDSCTYFNSYAFLNRNVVSVVFTSTAAPKVKTIGSLAQGVCLSFIGGTRNNYQ